MARPKKKISQKQFESLCAIQCTKEEICHVLGVTEKTLNNWCKETYGEGFSLVFSRRNQWKLAEKGNSTMQIWLGKQILKQSESPLLDEIKLKELEIKEKELELKLKEYELKTKDNEENAMTIKIIKASEAEDEE